jgi:hypothetical protein
VIAAPTTAPFGGTLIKPEAGQQVYWTKVSANTKVRIGMRNAWGRGEVGDFISAGARSVGKSDAATVLRANMNLSMRREGGVRSLPASTWTGGKRARQPRIAAELRSVRTTGCQIKRFGSTAGAYRRIPTSKHTQLAIDSFNKLSRFGKRLNARTLKASGHSHETIDFG